MAATVNISESNGAGETVTDGVTQINLGSTDAPNLNVSTQANQIVRGALSYRKYLRVHLSALGGSTQIAGIRIWKSAGTYKTGEQVASNCNVHFTYPAFNYTLVGSMDYATPVKTSAQFHTHAGNDIGLPTDANLEVTHADPGGTNMGIGLSLTGTLAAPGYSDYWVIQQVTASGTPVGALNQKIYTIQYDET